MTMPSASSHYCGGGFYPNKFLQQLVNIIVNMSTSQIIFILVYRNKPQPPIYLILGISANTSLQLLAYKASELAKKACEIISKAQNA